MFGRNIFRCHGRPDRALREATLLCRFTQSVIGGGHPGAKKERSFNVALDGRDRPAMTKKRFR
jgi:hypothetical protein